MAGTFGVGASGVTAAGDCPCGTGEPYAACCGPLHAGESVATTAEQLMRSRYAAYVRGDAPYLVRTWHPRHRPDPLEVAPDPGWLRLEVLDVVGGGEDDGTGEVEFVATHVDGPLHERSRFVRRAGRWVYLDGVVRD
ncbi:YchJ family protein [Phycicoccus sp. Root563]|uniref:YchJ family protein n=1 Tax=Phycicoccus sp. Root563 TaxID=1736562 RepID=UPI000702F764|nr:YchJ family metal-binding protein [Phycicoccus sp. Root563]KQZ87960.1 zinc chelation protein SecC [Phycicoccus sp. Root563]